MIVFFRQIAAKLLQTRCHWRCASTKHQIPQYAHNRASKSFQQDCQSELCGPQTVCSSPRRHSMIWCPQRRGMCHYRCSPMKVFPPDSKEWMKQKQEERESKGGALP